MIYSPNGAADAKLLSYTRDLLREALTLLRNSDHIAHAQRVRDELAKSDPFGAADAAQ
jgi:hypothetical protein